MEMKKQRNIRAQQRERHTWLAAWAVCLSLLIVTLCPTTTWGQTSSGTISGTVLDPGGAAVPGAEVVILNPATGQSRSVTTNDTGFFSAPNLVPANYEVTTSAAGFATVVEKVELKVGMEAQLNLQLKVGDVSEKVVIDEKQYANASVRCSRAKYGAAQKGRSK